MYASLAKYLPSDAEKNIIKIDVDNEISVVKLLEIYKVPVDSVHLVLVNGVYIVPSDRDKPIFKGGDVLALWPPVAGG